MARLVEVWEHFRVPMNKNDKIRMKKTFSIINLDKCSYEFESPPSPLNGMYSITFFFKGKKVFREEYTKLGLAKARLEWFLSFEPKKQKGEFEYKGMMIDIDDVAAFLNETTYSYRNISIVTSRIRINDRVQRKSCYTILEEIQKKFIR